MLTKKTNFHHSKLPAIGAVVRVRLLSHYHPSRKFIVTAYPLSDNAGGFGIHTCFLRALDNGQEVRVSGYLCADVLN